MLFPTSLVGSYPQPDWRPTRPCWPSGRRSRPAWTSSPRGRYAGRATPTGSRPRLTAWTSTTPAPRSTAAATRTRCRGHRADIVQLDEPYLQARPEPAHRYGVKVINRALEEAAGTTAVHLCFGYAAIIHDRPSGYSFLSELAECRADQISIETAQSGLDCSVLTDLDGKTIILGVLDLNDLSVESPETVRARVERAMPYVPPGRLVLAPDCGMKYLARDVAFGKLTALTAAGLRAEQGS